MSHGVLRDISSTDYLPRHFFRFPTLTPYLHLGFQLCHELFSILPILARIGERDNVHTHTRVWSRISRKPLAGGRESGEAKPSGLMLVRHFYVLAFLSSINFPRFLLRSMIKIWFIISWYPYEILRLIAYLQTCARKKQRQCTLRTSHILGYLQRIENF